MTTLRVGNIEALGGTGTITVPAGNKIKQAGAVLQVVSTTKSDTFTSTGTAVGSSVDITGLTATITPSSNTSKIMCFFSIYGSVNYTGIATVNMWSVGLYRGSTLIGAGNADGSRTSVTGSNGAVNSTTNFDGMSAISGLHLDSPATTSAITYKIAGINASQLNATMNLYINRPILDSNSAWYPRMASTLTVMEIGV